MAGGLVAKTNPPVCGSSSPRLAHDCSISNLLVGKHEFICSPDVIPQTVVIGSTHGYRNREVENRKTEKPGRLWSGTRSENSLCASAGSVIFDSRKNLLLRQQRPVFFFPREYCVRSGSSRGKRRRERARVIILPALWGSFQGFFGTAEGGAPTDRISARSIAVPPEIPPATC
ncbi:hypothetical protein VTG60DRAFT_7134 [Thermothelomyces hinnuleus]